MSSLSERFMYYSGILAASGLNVDINDLKHIQGLLEAEEQGELNPVVRGEWTDNEYVWECNQCHTWMEVTQGNCEMNFCPNCGADMRK